MNALANLHAMYGEYFWHGQDGGLPFGVLDILTAVKKARRIRVEAQKLAKSLGVSATFVRNCRDALEKEWDALFLQEVKRADLLWKVAV
jgi:hypothetical protein